LAGEGRLFSAFLSANHSYPHFLPGYAGGPNGRVVSRLYLLGGETLLLSEN
jgi:hypothetical protein